MAAKLLRLIIVTPEKTLFDALVASLRFPLYDGQIGILPNRLPLVGRLGKGDLHLVDERGLEKVIAIEGGFVQVADDVVSLLTSRAVLPVTATSA